MGMTKPMMKILYKFNKSSLEQQCLPYGSLFVCQKLSHDPFSCTQVIFIVASPLS
jgi:hypothetical protein